MGGLFSFWKSLANRYGHFGGAERYNRNVRIRKSIFVLGLLAAIGSAQNPSNAPASNAPANASPSAPGGGESSSRDTRIDVSPPKDDAKGHPGSADAIEALGIPGNSDNPDTTGVQEFHPWSPLKAIKDIEVGDFYFKRKNYKAALERYKEALYYKNNDAVATFHVAVCEQKLGNKDEARKYYEQYLKILPEGPSAKDAQASLDKLAKAK
jgi:tetratricopeptide (TPR) repeat protein